MQVPFDVWRQYYLPQRTLTWMAGKLAYCEIPWFKNWAIRRFIRLYGVNVNEALESSPEAYRSFHHFFIRQLKPNSRAIDNSPSSIVSPCDGTISQIGKIEHETLIQAKNHSYTLGALLGDEQKAKPFIDGHYATIYLAPKDYHRVHMPLAGTLENLTYIPGKLFSVNPLTADHVPQLFARNERVVTLFKNPHGTFAMILIGAMLVGSIFTRWSGHLTPHRGKTKISINYPDRPERHITLDKGEEMGYFSLGSTVILLFTKDQSWEQELAQHSRIVVGQRIGHLLS